MKTVSVAMDAHLKQGATTLTTCWKITRTDGREFFYTELDRDIPFEGEVYKSAAGFNKSAITSSATFAVDKMEVTGFLRDDGITDDEIRNGAFDHAKVEVFMVNYEDASMGKIRLRAGWFGEVRTTASGAFLVELRGLIDQLQVKIGRTYLPECGVDLGSPKCGIKLVPDLRNAGAYYKTGDRVIWPVGVADYAGDRHFPDLVDPNITDVWPNNHIKVQDLNVTPYKGPKMVRAATANIFPTAVSCYLTFDDLGFTKADAISGLYQVTFSAKTYRMGSDTNGRLAVACQEQYFNTGIYTTVTSESTKISNDPPRRKWVPYSVTIDVDAATDRFEVQVIADADPSGKSVSELLADDLDFTISLKANQVSDFVAYGGVEFEAVTDGKTSTADIDFDITIGADTVDGGVTWRAVIPKYTFLRAITANMTSTTRLVIDPVGEAWENFFDWGVVKFLSGANAGRAMEIQNYDATTGAIKLALPLPYQGLAGDIISIQAGCNKTKKNCKLFNNVLNFRGFDRVPGQGQYFKIAGM